MTAQECRIRAVDSRHHLVSGIRSVVEWFLGQENPNGTTGPVAVTSSCPEQCPPAKLSSHVCECSA